MIKNLRIKFLLFFLTLISAAGVMIYTLYQSISDHAAMIRFETNVVQPLDHLATSALHVESRYLQQLLPEGRSNEDTVLEITQWRPEVQRIFAQLHREVDYDPAMRNIVEILQKDWDRYIETIQAQNRIGDAIIDNSKSVLVRYINAYQAFHKSLDYNRRLLFSQIMGQLTQNLNRQKNLFYFALAIFIISFGLMTTVLLGINRMNKKLQNYLYTKEEYQKQLDEANAKLSRYSKELEQEVKKRTHEALEHLLYHPLTKLPNRTNLLQQIENLDRASAALFNIDNFVAYNDLFGAEVGDRIIKAYAKFLRESIPLRYTLYHLQGDEFAIVETDPKHHDHFKKRIEEIAKKVYEFHYLDLNGDFLLHLSIGVAVDTSDALIKADMALKHAKKSKERIVYFSDTLIKPQQILANINMTKELSQAIKEDRIIPYLQPIAEAETGRIVKYETLARLIDSNGNIHPPKDFIPLAKTVKLYPEITRIIFEKALQIAQTYDIDINVNISAEDIKHHDTKESIIRHLMHSKAAHHLTFEMLETDEIDNYDDIRLFFTQIKTQGVKVAIDDFGSGYSNFAEILKLHVDYLKLDGSFIERLDRDEEAREFVRVINDLAHGLHIETIAEFVTTEEILQVLRELNVDYVQGYLIGEPKSIEEILAS